MSNVNPVLTYVVVATSLFTLHTTGVSQPNWEDRGRERYHGGTRHQGAVPTQSSVKDIFIQLNKYERSIADLIAMGYSDCSTVVINARQKRDEYLICQQRRVEKARCETREAYSLLKARMSEYANPVMHLKMKLERLNTLNDRIQQLVCQKRIRELMIRVQLHERRREYQQALVVIASVLKLDPDHERALACQRRCRERTRVIVIEKPVAHKPRQRNRWEYMPVPRRTRTCDSSSYTHRKQVYSKPIIRFEWSWHFGRQKEHSRR